MDKAWLSMKLVFGIHLLSTLYMFGLIWFVQVVHYPLFAQVGETDFVAYERLHTMRTGWVVAPMMLAELFSALYLLFTASFSGNLYWWFVGSIVALGLIWASTFFIQVPLHGSLSEQYDLAKIKRLVSTNWIRTVLWSLRAVIVVYILLHFTK